APDWRSKAAREARDEANAAGKIPALMTDMGIAAAMRDAVFANSVARTLLFRGKAEVSMYATDPDTGVKMRSRPDWLPHGEGRPVIVDYKTTRDANPNRDAFRNSAFAYG